MGATTSTESPAPEQAPLGSVKWEIIKWSAGDPVYVCTLTWQSETDGAYYTATAPGKDLNKWLGEMLFRYPTNSAFVGPIRVGWTSTDKVSGNGTQAQPFDMHACSVGFRGYPAAGESLVQWYQFCPKRSWKAYFKTRQESIARGSRDH